MEFCLRWNNYQSTLQHVFHKLWMSGTFVDASLVVEGRRIDCHKVVLSACSSYFEDILQEHSNQNHPLILLHDMPFAAVEALVAFMYRGEVNVSYTQLESLLQVAEALKVKGLADSSTLSNFTKKQLLERCIPFLEHAQGAAAAVAALNPNRFTYIPGTVTNPTTTLGQPRMMSTTVPSAYDRSESPVAKQPAKAVKRPLRGSRSPVPKKRRSRSDRGVPSLPSSPGSVDDSSPCDGTNSSVVISESSQPSPPPVPPLTTPEMLKQEASDETDGELQIDESAGQSPEGSVEGDTNGTGNECEKEACTEEAKVVSKQEQPTKTNVASEVPPLEPARQPQQTQTPCLDSFSVPKERKSIERTYTHLDLEQGIEAVLLGHLTPAKAIAQYRIPRRTFFRRLSAVRKSRGIPSAKENAADQFLNSSNANKESNNQLQPVTNSDVYAAPFKVKAEKQLPLETKDSKAKMSKKNAAVMTPNNSYFTLLKLAATNNYDSYIKYLRMVAQQSGHSKPEELLEALKKGHLKDLKQTVDDNRNVATDVSGTALCLVNKNIPSEVAKELRQTVDDNRNVPTDISGSALCLVNKNVSSEVPESPLSLVNGNKKSSEVPEGLKSPCQLSDNTVTVVPEDDDDDAPVNLCNGKDRVQVSRVKMETGSPEELEVGEIKIEECEIDSSPGSPSHDLTSRNLIPATVADLPQNLIIPGNLKANSADTPQNLVSRNATKMTAEVS